MNDKEQREGESIFDYDARRADENEADAERLPVAEAALTECQHISHDTLATFEEGTTYYVRMIKLQAALEKIQSVSESGEPSRKFAAMLAKADREEAKG